MTDTREPAAVLEFSDDLHLEDVGPLREFLDARLSELAHRMTEGSDAHFAASTLAEIVRSDCIHLEDSLVAWEDVVAARRVSEPGPTQALRQDIGAWWNRLCRVAARFRDHPGHRPRWRELRYLCVEHAEFVEAATGDLSTGPYEDGAHP